MSPAASLQAIRGGALAQSKRPAAGGGKRGDRLAEAQAAEAKARQGDWTEIVAQGDPEDLEKVGCGRPLRLADCTALHLAELSGAVTTALAMCMSCLFIWQQRWAAASTGAWLPLPPHCGQSVSVSWVVPRCDAGPAVAAGGGLCCLSQQCPPQQHLPRGVHRPRRYSGCRCNALKLRACATGQAPPGGAQARAEHCSCIKRW